MLYKHLLPPIFVAQEESSLLGEFFSSVDGWSSRQSAACWSSRQSAAREDMERDLLNTITIFSEWRDQIVEEGDSMLYI